MKEVLDQYIASLEYGNLAEKYTLYIEPIRHHISSDLTLIDERVTDSYIRKLALYCEYPDIFLNNYDLLSQKIKEQPGYQQLLIQLWSVPPGEVLTFFLELHPGKISDILQFTSFERYFTIELGDHKDEHPIYFLYDAKDDDSIKEWDIYLNKTIAINGDEQVYHYAYHLAWPTLLAHYYPERKIILTSRKESIRGAYIYVLTFRYFQHYLQTIDPNQDILPPVRTDVLQDCRDGRAIILFNDCHESANYKTAFRFLSKALARNNILYNTFIFSGDTANTGRLLKLQKRPALWRILNGLNHVKSLQFFTLRYFEEAVSAVYRNFYPDYSYDKRYYSLQQNGLKVRPLLCFNRVVKDFRVILSYLFYKNNLLEKAYISQAGFRDEKDYMYGHNQNTRLNQLIEPSTFQYFRESLPWTVDTPSFATNHWNTINLDILEQAFVWVTSETEFGSVLPEERSFITEKTYKPIAFFMPFIVAGTPYTLQTLQQEGYKTFSRWWDESYDHETDPLRRMRKIESLLILISQWDHQKMMQVYHEMQEVLTHNHAMLLNNKRSQTALNQLIQAYDKLN